jgi:CheY-like chemotaxis protein
MARVLIVDDEKVTAELLSMAMSIRGHTPFIAYHAVQGLEMVASERLDIILLDLMMPGMDGYEMLASLRSMPEGKALPVIVLTASHEDNLEQHVYTAGGNVCLRKPIDMRALEKAISELTNDV